MFNEFCLYLTMLTIKYLIKKVNTILLKVKNYNLGVDNIHIVIFLLKCFLGIYFE